MRNVAIPSWMISLICSLLAVPGFAQEQSSEDFKEYVVEKMGDRVSDEQLQAIVKLVDKNRDGNISDEEFADRMEIVRGVLSGELKAKDAEPADDEPVVPMSNTIEPSTDLAGPKSKQPAIATVLLITADELAASWQPFADWKTQNGKQTKIITVQQIDRDFQAESIQEKIRLCVRQHIDNHKTYWVILGGDSLPGGKGLVPGGHTTIHKQERKGIPTDIVYLSDKNWDADKDGIYGEFDDDREAISYPDGSVGLGRIPVRNAADVKAFTDKVIAYESNYPTTDFATNMVYTCTDSPAYPKVRNSWDGYVSKVWDGRVNQFFSQETPWDEPDEPGSYPLSSENLVKLFNDKQTGKLHIHGHGHLPSWILEDSKFTGKHVGQLQNKGAYPLITTVSCNTGEYDSKKDPSIVEQMLRAPNAGSVAVVAPIRTGKAHFANRSDFRLMVKEGKLDGTTLTMTRYWQHGLDKSLSTGHALMSAKHAMSEQGRQSAAYHLCICELNLLGDPTLDMRAKTPTTPEIEVTASKVIKGSRRLTIKTNSPECTVCLSDGKKLYRVWTANEQGVASGFVEESPSSITVSVSGANLNTVVQKGLTSGR